MGFIKLHHDSLPELKLSRSCWKSFWSIFLETKHSYVRLRPQHFTNGFILHTVRRDTKNTIIITQINFDSPAALTTPPIHLPAASKNPLQFRSAWAHLSFLQLSHLSVIFLLQFSFSLMTAFLASESLLCASSKAPLTAFAAASKAWKKVMTGVNYFGLNNFIFEHGLHYLRILHLI